MVCTFCRNKGIPGPHNHTVRNWTLPDKPIICPQLLATQCTFCEVIGHTKQYCPLRHCIIKNSIEIKIENNLKRELENMEIKPNKVQKN